LTSNVNYDKEFKAYNPTDNIFEKTNYAIAVGEITEKM
jgi:hypothetical protein